MNINYEYYRVFYYVAKLKSFTQAAETLMNSQPNITRTIRNLERELGCVLFIRTNRQVHLTAEGEALYRHVSVAVEQLCAAEEELSRGQGLEGGILRIAATEVALRTVLLPVLKVFRRFYPSVHIKLINDTTPAAIADLEAGLADLAVVTAPAAIPEALHRIPLMDIHEVAVAGSTFAALAQKPCSLEALSRYPLISLGEQTGTYAFYASLFAMHHLDFSPDIEAATADQILPMVKANLGVGFVPRLFVHEEDIGVTLYPIMLAQEIPPRNICLLHSACHVQSPAARELERFLTQAAAIPSQRESQKEE